WSAVAVAVLAGVVAAMHIGKLPPALPLIREDLGFGLVMGGFVVSLFSVLGMTLAVFLGAMADWLGRERLVVLGFSCLVAGGALGAAAQGLPLLMLGRLVEGIGFISVSVGLPAVVFRAAARRDQPLALAIWSVFTPLGMSLAMLAAPWALAALGWRGSWWALAAVCPVIAAAVLVVMRRLGVPRGSQVRFLPLVLQALACRGFLLIALTFMAYAFQWVTLMVWLPTFLGESLGSSLESAALVTALIVLMNVPGCLLGGWLMRRGASARGLVLAGSLIMALAATGIFLPGLPGPARMVLCVAFSFFGGLIPPSLFNSVPAAAPSAHHVGAGNGMLMQGSALGQFIGAPAVAVAVAWAGGNWSAALIPMLSACALTMIAGNFVDRWRAH
ncbi:MAG: MFS transporter, partial [Paracoccaceae bacterium]|nr:MFS transporter [Paracoccaceae bacterium]